MAEMGHNEGGRSVGGALHNVVYLTKRAARPTMRTAGFINFSQLMFVTPTVVLLS
jgi:hypothetical protein